MSSYDNIAEHNLRKPPAYECQKKQVIRTNNDGEEVAFDCLRAAAEAVDGTKSGVAQCCNGKIRIYKGFRFRYASRHICKKPLSSDVDSGFLLFYNWSLLFLYTA